ncbi:MAG: RteC domain-containing protein [Bacteroidia bacterium]
MGKLASTGSKNLIYDRFFQIKIKIDEADILINPRDKDLVFARITFLGSSRLALTKPQIDLLKSILINYVQVQRSYLKLIKGTTKNIASFYAPELVLRYGKRKIKGQHTLFPPNAAKSLSWQSETIKLVELGAALAATKAFGPEVSRKQVWDFLSSSMSCPLDKAEQALSQMKHRKNSQLKFLDEMSLAMTDLLERGL